jgi:hypothetical protein
MKLDKKMNHKCANRFCRKYFYDEIIHGGSQMLRLCLAAFRGGLGDVPTERTVLFIINVSVFVLNNH